MNKTDTHVHSEHSHDSICPIEEMRSSALKKDVDLICITDHCDIGYCDEIDVEKIITESVNDSKKYDGVLSGVEISEVFWNMEVAKKILDIKGLDQVIGSVHAVKFKDYIMPYSKIDFSEMTFTQIDEYFNTYLDDIKKLIKTFDFDILAHLSCPLRYINGKYNIGLNLKDYEEKIKIILALIIERNIALEINTSCKGSNYDEYMPEEWIIRLYKDMGGNLITLGSDAHISENLAHNFNDLYILLKEIGFTHTCYFKNRKLYTEEIK